MYFELTRTVRTGLLCVLLLLLTACSAGTPRPEPLGVVIRAHEFQFDVPAITARVRQTTTLRFENTGVLDHALALDEWGVRTETVRPGQVAEVTFTPQKAGTYTFYCAVAGHLAAGMVGTLTVAP